MMGLAPYADQEVAKFESKKLHNLLKFSNNGLDFKLNSSLSTNYSYFYFKIILNYI